MGTLQENTGLSRSRNRYLSMRKQKFPYLVGSRWTAQNETFGWRHFQVLNRQNEGSLIFAELVASCDRSTRFWINAQSLKDRRLWQPGWQSLAESAQRPQPMPSVDTINSSC